MKFTVLWNNKDIFDFDLSPISKYIDNNYYNIIKSLQYLDKFDKFVKATRKLCDIPIGGIDYLSLSKSEKKRWIKIAREPYPQDFRIENTYRKGSLINRFHIHMFNREVEGIIRELGLYKSLERWPLRMDISMITLFNTVPLIINEDDEAIIGIENYFSIEEEHKLLIRINGLITKSKLLNFIERNFDELIKPNLVRLPELPTLNISPRDQIVLEKRYHEKMTFPEIVKYLETNGYSYSEEDDIKMAYHRCIKRINKFFKVTPQ